MHKIRVSAAQHMTHHRYAAETEHAAQAMFLGNLVAGGVDRMRGLLQRLLRSSLSPAIPQSGS